MTRRDIAIAVLGAGSWGTALAIQAARNGHTVRLWGRDPAQMAAMAGARCNLRYIPDVPFPDGLSAMGDLEETVEGADAVLVAVPSYGFRATLEQIAPAIGPKTPVFWASKGLEPGTRKLLHEVAAESVGARPLGVVSGPTFAAEVAKGLPTAVTVASDDPLAAADFAACLHCNTFRTYTSGDVIGVELGGATKNVLAIAAGIADGLGFGANTRAALITRGLAELMRLGVRVGGQPETFMGLAGLGDLVLTCTDDQSRNRRLGLALGRGQPVAGAMAAIGQAVEGVKTAPEILALAQTYDIDMPITEQVCRVLTGEVAPQAAVEALLSREPKAEVG